MLDPVRKGGFQAEDAGVLATFGFRLGCLNILTILGSLSPLAPFGATSHASSLVQTQWVLGVIQLILGKGSARVGCCFIA